VKDEELHIGETIRSMLGQVHRPRQWIIVDDGSSDSTPSIVAAKTSGVDWVTFISMPSGPRDLGVREVRAFQTGFAHVRENLDWEYVVKLDGDLMFDARYFADLLGRMAEEPTWGIGSGIYRERHGATWKDVKMPAYHAAGASKIVRRDCYRQIGGFLARKGWDTVDEIRAGLRGWRTGHARDIAFYHLKAEGSAMGPLATQSFHGAIYYRTGGGFLFLSAKVIHRMCTTRPLVVGGLAMLWGYLAARMSGKQRVVDEDEARFYRACLNRRLAAPFISVLHAIRH
jgi:glycosyltransferase involved in cell wall biosynthesis